MLAEVLYQFHLEPQLLKSRLSASARCVCLQGPIQLQHPVGMSSAGSVLLSGAIRSQNALCVGLPLLSHLLCVFPMLTSDPVQPVTDVLRLCL